MTKEIQNKIIEKATDIKRECVKCAEYEDCNFCKYVGKCSADGFDLINEIYSICNCECGDCDLYHNSFGCGLYSLRSRPQDWKLLKIENSSSNNNDNKEMVNHPEHYKGNKFEVIDIIEDYNLGFHLGNALKYILRAGKKDETIQEIDKAIWYLKRYEEILKKI